MNTDKLVRMANQIAEFFESYPEPEGLAGVREHIHAFWTPRMVAALRERAAGEETGLSRLAAGAMRGDPAGESPVAKVVSGPGELGEMADDAG